MSIRVVGRGFEIPSSNVNESEDFSYKYNGEEAKVHTHRFTDKERKLGWKQLPSGHRDVMAWRVDDTVVLMRRPGVGFMAQIPDDRSLAEVTLPGSHESTSLSGGFISECQTVDLAQQLRDGCRFVDIRLKVKDGELKTYHGIQPQNSTFKQQADWIEAFLREHPSETVMVSIKQEQENHPEFSNKIYDIISKSGMWVFAGHIPKLSEVRGKAILFSRYGAPYSEGGGIHPSSWPDSRKEGFEWDCCGVPFRIQDWYEIPNSRAVGEKAQALINHLEPTCGRSDGQHPFTLSFASASKFPDATPKWVATGTGAIGMGSFIGASANLFRNVTQGNENGSRTDASEIGVNARLVKWLLQRAAECKRPRAVVMLDFYRDNMNDDGHLALLLAALNFVTDD